ncbi:MAG: hypothetical protein H7Z75_11030 [Ferruginibacter sp.]|nr:hypothetical protein [Cytophagales bacterium]
MNALSEIDQALLKRLKQKIEQCAGLAGVSDLNQKDFDFLLFYIQEKTGQALSLTTVKRIWRDEYQRLPHLSTLNMLARLADGKDWHTLKKELLESQAPEQTDGRMPPPVGSPVAASSNPPRRGNMKRVAAALLLLLLLGTCWYYVSAHQTGKVNAVQFSAVPTAGGRVPNSVVFSYDVTGIKADHFYIQQSWDPARKVEISAKNNTQTDIYYEPGYHYAKLLADEQVVKEIPVHIQYQDWYVRFRYPNSALVKVNEADLHTQGHLGLKTDYVTTRFRPLQEEFQLGYMWSRDFQWPADECQIQASVRFDSLHVPLCPVVSLLIKGDRDYAWITLGNVGCESNLGLKVGDTYVDGKTHDLSLLGMDAFCWQQIRVQLSQGRYRLSVNDRVVREGRYSNFLGDLKEIDFFFNGIGSLDEIHIEDQQHHSLLSQHF